MEIGYGILLVLMIMIIALSIIAIFKTYQIKYLRNENESLRDTLKRNHVVFKR